MLVSKFGDTLSQTAYK